MQLCSDHQLNHNYTQQIVQEENENLQTDKIPILKLIANIYIYVILITDQREGFLAKELLVL